MLHFYPGPSKLHAHVSQHMNEAVASGLLSMNHRSDAFMQFYLETYEKTKLNLKLPEMYALLFTSSATEWWQLLTQSFAKSTFHHVYNGSFGEKWKEVSESNAVQVVDLPFDLQRSVDLSFITHTENDVLCLTQVETSTGYELKPEVLIEIRAHWKGLIAVDATSAMGGIETDFSLADIWFASVQKCFGLPSGLAVGFVSERVKECISEPIKHYNNLSEQLTQFKKFQTTHTPSILGMYLFNRRLEDYAADTKLYYEVKNHALLWKLFSGTNTYNYAPLIPEEFQSNTVFTIAYPSIATLMNKASHEGLILGNGYGNYKSGTFRIANFPAHTLEEIKKLQEWLVR
jgi:phosphoserine aminotransferase